MFRFVAIVSIFMVFPDWFLSNVLHSIRFIHDAHDVYRIGGDVPVYMAFMWTIPLLWILAAFQRRRPSDDKSLTPAETTLAELAKAAALSLAIFGVAELALSADASPLRLWTATASQRVFHVALYVLVPEAALGAASLAAYRSTITINDGAPWWQAGVRRLLAGAAVATFYTGALAISFLLIEGA